MKKYYHYTNVENLANILLTKQLRGHLGVFACETKEDALKFVNGYCNIMKKFSLDDTVLIEFETDAKFEESYDHSPTFFNNANAVVCWDKVVPISNIIVSKVVVRK